jgi:sulfate permease, SulP family
MAEQEILTLSGGDILLFQLGGPMSFGAAKSISRRMSMVKNYQVLVLDLSEVPTIGITAALAIESMVEDAVKRHRQVWIVVSPGPVEERIKTLDLPRFCGLNKPCIYQVNSRFEALKSALDLINMPISVE